MTTINARSLRWISALAGWALLAAAGSARADFENGLINVDFNSGGATQSGGAVLGAAGDTWNGILAAGPSSAASALVDSNGLPTEATIEWVNATGGFDVGGPGSSFDGTPYIALMRDYLVVEAPGTATVTVGGLTPVTRYELVLYGYPAHIDHATRFTVGGLERVSRTDGAVSAFVEGDSYVLFATATSDADGRLAIDLASWGGNESVFEGDLNGLQIRQSSRGAASLIRDINGVAGTIASASPSSPSELTDVNGRLFLAADDGTNGRQVWTSDGTAAGTVLPVKNTYAGYPSATWLTNVNGTLFFVSSYFGRDPDRLALHRTDGTRAGTSLVGRTLAANGVANPTDLTDVNGTLFFTANDGTIGRELWTSDGTDGGTVLVKDIFPGAGSTELTELTNVNGTLFFTANDGTNGWQLWTSDGTADGTFALSENLPGNYASHPSSLTDVNGTLFFAADDGVNGTELWKSDGSEGGTVLVMDIRPGGIGDLLHELTDVNGTLFFAADDGVNGTELWKSDGTEGGTVLVKDLLPGVGSSDLSGFTNANGRLFFAADDGVNGTELWTSDGTEGGTVLVRDISPAPGDSPPPAITALGDSGIVVFPARDDSAGVEIWRSDGTAAGTFRVADVAPGVLSSNPHAFTVSSLRVYFAADDVTTPMGEELWGIPLAKFGVQVAFIDSDADGYPDEIEEALGTLPLDAASTPLDLGPADAPLPLPLRKLGISLKFAKTGSDRVSVTGKIPVSAGFRPEGTSVIVGVGGVVRTFTLDAKGKARTDSGDSFKLKVRTRDGVVTKDKLAKFTLKLAAADLADTLFDEDLVDTTVRKAPRSVPVLLFAGTAAYRIAAPVQYTAKDGKRGSTRLQKQ